MNYELRTMNYLTNEQITHFTTIRYTLYAIRSTLHAIRNTQYEALYAIFFHAIRNTQYARRNCPLQLSRELYKSPLFMQNKPKVKIGKMNITSYITKDYENETLGESGKNKAKQTQTKPKRSGVPYG